VRAQGDREKELGMSPMHFMNREKGQCVPSAQARTLAMCPSP
jgi:hypothetical protein